MSRKNLWKEKVEKLKDKQKLKQNEQQNEKQNEKQKKKPNEEEENEEINWGWYDMFEIPDTYAQKPPCPSYYSWLEPNIYFSKYKACDGFSYVTTIQNAFHILNDGLTFEPMKEFSIVSEHEAHPLHNENILLVSPTYGLGHTIENSAGNVQFTGFSLSMYHDYNFYIVEYLNFNDKRTVRLLITANTYKLHQFDVKTDGNPLLLNENGFFVAQEFFAKDKNYDEAVTVEILLDHISLSTMQYVPCPNPKAAINNDKYEGKIAAFSCDAIGQLFYCLLLHQNKSAHHKYNACINIDAINLIRKVQKSDRNDKAASFDINEVGISPDDNANECISSVELYNVIQSNTYLNLRDYNTIKKMAKLYHFKHDSPDGFVMVTALHKGYVKFLRECDYNAKRDLSTVITCLLNHFMTQEQVEDVKSKVVEYVRKQTNFRAIRK